MAILPQVPGLTASVHIDDVEAEEHGGSDQPDITSDTNKPTPRWICYIEAKTNQTFFPRISISYPFFRHMRELPVTGDCLCIESWVDGRRASTMVQPHFRDHPWALTCDMRSQCSNEDGTWNERDFCFTEVSSVDDTEDDRVMDDKKTVDRLGRIDICVKLGVSKLQSTPATATFDSSRFPSSFELAEEATKGMALSHGSSVCAEPVNNRQAFGSCRFKTTYEMCHIRFEYRSREALYELAVIPRPPPLICSPVDLLTQPDVESMSRDELQSIVQEFFQQQASQQLQSTGCSSLSSQMIKNEPTMDWKPSSFAMTRTPLPPVRITTFTTPDGQQRELMDLTDD